MARRALQASTAGIEKAKRAFKRKEWTQEYLASEVGIETRQPIWKFFSGKPVDRHIFIDICFQLDLDWQDVAELPDQQTVREHQVDCLHVDDLVQVVRSRRHDKIQAQCGTVRLLDTAQLIELDDIYVSVNILEALPSQNWTDVSHIQNCSSKDFDSFELAQSSSRNLLHLTFELEQADKKVSASKAVTTYSRLMVLGKIGCGKTTFLQHIAMQCNQGELLPDRIPIFIKLKNLAEDTSQAEGFSLLTYIYQELAKSDILEQQVKTLLQHGKALILLDGLDEVQKRDSDEILKQIRKLSEEYYKNQIIITSRTAAQQYQFDGFTDIEVADFDQAQVAAFAQKWFVTVGQKHREEGLTKAAQFIEKLQLPENRLIRLLAVTPLLLNLACSLFTAKADFPRKCADFYNRALDVLLRRWDEARGIKRDAIYGHLSLPHKIKLLSQIAATTFEQGSYFFKQTTLQQHIINYLCTLPNAQTDPEVLQYDSQAILKSIEAQHGLLVERARGIYSFSHLAFQEYLTARNIIASPSLQVLNKNLNRLASHMSEPRWREVILLTADMLGNADALLLSMKQYSDQLTATDEQLQQFLVWLQQKSLAIQSHKPMAVRAFYLTLTLARELNLAHDLNLPFSIEPTMAGNLASELALDLALERSLSLSLALPENPTLASLFALGSALPLDSELAQAISPLRESLQHLRAQLPTDGGVKVWCNHQAWTAQLRTSMIQYRNIGHLWQFSERQKQTLRQYYETNRLLVDCLNSDCQMSPTVYEEVQEALLLPVAEFAFGSVKTAGVKLDITKVVKPLKPAVSASARST